MLIVDKTHDEKRVIVDHHMLNKETLEEKHPLPNIDDQFEGFAGANFYAVSDIAKAYLQGLVTKEAKMETAFITSDKT